MVATFVALVIGVRYGATAGYAGGRVERAMVRLPSESNGVAMVFLTFDRVSYALILQSQQAVRVGDRLVNPE